MMPISRDDYKNIQINKIKKFTIVMAGLEQMNN